MTGAIDAHRTHENEAPHAGLAGRFQQTPRGDDIIQEEDSRSATKLRSHVI
jgi:hypothetical protein